MTIDFLIGAIRASRDLHPQVKTELEEILRALESDEGKYDVEQNAEIPKPPKIFV